MAKATCPKCRQSGVEVRDDRTFDNHTDRIGKQCAGSFLRVDSEANTNTATASYPLKNYGFPGRGGIDR